MNYSKLRSVTTRRIIQALEADGFLLRRQTGSHRLYQHTDGRKVSLSFHHSSDTFPVPTLKSIIERQSRWSEQDLRRLGLLK